jgi:hypothetical protein
LGRTNPTFRDLLTAIEGRWKPYRRALRRQDQQRFDQLFEDARSHADAAGYQNADEPLFPVLVSILLAQQRRIEDLQARLDALEDDSTAARDDGAED